MGIKEAVMPFIRNCFLLTVISLIMLTSCPGGDDNTTKEQLTELIEILQGNPKKESQWGSLNAYAPNNIGNTFYTDPRTTRTITWQSAINSGEVIIGDNRYPSTVGEKDGNYYFHRVNITGLVPGNTYRFIAGSSDRYSPIYSFKTENSNYPNGFSVLHITDPQIRSSKPNAAIDAKVWKQVIETAVRKCPDAAFVANTGDVVDKIEEDRIKYYFDYAQEMLAKYAFIYSLGNNDSLDWYDKYFYITGNRNVDNSSGVLYSFDYGNTHFVSMNVVFIDFDDDDENSNQGLSAEQMAWLKNDLQTTSKKWKVVMTHKSDFGRKGGNDSKSDITELFEICNVNLVMAGHYHYYMRTYPIERFGNPIANGTVYSIPNYAGTKFNPKESTKKYLAVSEQPELPMFTVFTFTDTHIYLKAYTVDSNGNVVLFDEYVY